MLPLSPIYRWNILCIVSAWHLAACASRARVSLRKPHKPERYWRGVSGWILSFDFFLFVLISCFCSHREVWNVQYRILQSMQAKNCGTLFSVYGICKCTGRNYLYFSNAISLLWGKTNSISTTRISQTMQMRIWLLLFLIVSLAYMLSSTLMPGPQIWLFVGLGIQIDH